MIKTLQPNRYTYYVTLIAEAVWNDMFDLIEWYTHNCDVVDVHGWQNVPKNVVYT